MPAPDLLHDNLAKAAVNHPDRVAFKYLDQALTYRELDRESDRLAGVLARLGFSAGDRAGVFMNRCLETAVAVYGILKAGGAYVPIDPQAPAERVAEILQRCQINVLVTHDTAPAYWNLLADRCPDLHALVGINPGLVMDESASRFERVSWTEVSQEPAILDRVNGVDENSLAYIMFTSGSTGVPKGIIHTHRSGQAYARFSAQTYGIDHRDVIGNHAPLHFDISTMGYLTAPYAAATTVVVSEGHARMPASLASLVEKDRLTIWYSVPFALIQLLTRGALEKRDLDSVRWVLYGGEPFSPKHLRALMDRFQQARFSNVYGPAEVNQCTYYHLPANLTGLEDSIPIGQTCQETRALIVDESMQPVATGETGELLVSTPTMMQGYWQNPALNAACFHRPEKPSAGVEPGSPGTYYRTGDRVSLEADGWLHYHGRMDRQVKVRGNRIELDEVEAAMTSHADVEEAAAYLLDAGTENERIEAAVLGARLSMESPEALTVYARNRLPRYAVPGQIVIVDSFPRTTSGKIDRVAQRRLREGMHQTEDFTPTSPAAA